MFHIALEYIFASSVHNTDRNSVYNTDSSVYNTDRSCLNLENWSDIVFILKTLKSIYN